MILFDIIRGVGLVFMRCIYVLVGFLIFSGSLAAADRLAAVDRSAHSRAGVIRNLDGREVYVQSCAMCHANGVGGAPRHGRGEDWAGRMQFGAADLLVSVLRGKGGMPPKGGNASLTSSEASVALEYMLNEAR